MVDDKSESYRPRRAFVEPEPPVESKPTPPQQPPAAPPAAPVPDDDEAPKPLYRDEVGPGARPIVPPTAQPPSGSGSDTDTGMRAITFVPRQRRSFDDDSTTVLPRTRVPSRRDEPAEQLDDAEDEGGRRPLGQRTRLALLIGGVAAVIVIGLGIGYAVLGVQATPQGGTTPATSLAPTAASTPADSASATPTPTALLTDDQLLTPAQAAVLDPKRTWKVSLTQRAATSNFPQAACFTTDPVEGEPTPEQKVARVLGASGKNAPSVLHLGTAYSSPEEAGQAFAIAAKTLGGCPVVGSWIASGRVISGLGDQATGVVVTTGFGKATQVHSMVLARTGRVLDLVDAAQPADSLSITKTAQAVGALMAVQCTASGGGCDATPAVKAGPPPIGGDVPGYLATGDLPPAGSADTTWVATSVEPPKADFRGSSCETVDWSTLSAEDKNGRVYLVQDSGKAFFGLNEIVLTLKDSGAAQKLVDKIKGDLNSCKERKLTATVTKPAAVDSVGARNAKVAGYTSLVTQKSVDGPQRYRVGIVATGDQVVYTYLNPSGSYDFTDAQWDVVAVRAGERATQVN